MLNRAKEQEGHETITEMGWDKWAGRGVVENSCHVEKVKMFIVLLKALKHNVIVLTLRPSLSLKPQPQIV